MKLQISPTLRVSFGLLMITLSIVFASDWLGLIPREETLRMENRKHFSETVAVLFSSMAQKGDSLHFNSSIKHYLRNVGKSDAELIVVVYTP